MTLEVDIRVRRGDFLVTARFSAEPGETVALLGPNGAGKSTIVASLAGLDPPEAGRVTLDGVVLDDAEEGIHVPPAERPIAVVFQLLHLFPHLSALENVAFPLRARRVSRSEARSRAATLLSRLDVVHRAAARPGDLSGGEAQRVALARALVTAPRLFLMDEPLSAFDVEARADIRGMLRRVLWEFEGVRMLVTHDPVEAMTLADRMVLLEGGRVTQVGTPQEIREIPRTRYAAELVGTNLFAGRLVRAAGGAGILSTGEGDVVVGWPQGLAGSVEEAIGLLRPSDVAIHTAPPPSGSPRNVFDGEITAISREGERARVRLASSPRLVAEVTTGSVSRLGLREGTRVWASFKALEVQVIAPWKG